MKFWALEWAKDQAIYDKLTTGETSLKSIAIWAWAGSLLWAWFRGASKMLSKDIPINPSKAGAYTEPWMLWKAADNLSTKFNRIDPTKEIDFQKMTGETVGQFLNKRGINEVGSGTVDKLSDLFQKSINEADNWLALIKGKFKMTQGDDFVWVALDDLSKKLHTELSPQRWLIDSLSAKYASGGLTQTEINSLKRLYQQNNKFGYLKEAIDPTGVARATNILDGIRDWQFKTAGDNWFTNLNKINKNTQAYKFLTKEIQRKIDKASGNNAVSITDWIVATGSPYGLPWVIGKKLVSSDTAKSLLLKWLNKGRQTIEPLAKASKDDIIKAQVKKVYGLSNNDYSDLSFSGTLDRKGLKALPSPSWKPLTNSGVIDVKPVISWPRGANPSEITSRSKIVKPWTYTETPVKKEVQATVIPKSQPKAKLRTNEDALKKAELPKKPVWVQILTKEADIKYKWDYERILKVTKEQLESNEIALKKAHNSPQSVKDTITERIGSNKREIKIAEQKLNELKANETKLPKTPQEWMTGNSYIDYFNKNEPYWPSESKFLESVKWTPEGEWFFTEIERNKMPRFTVTESQKEWVKLILDDGKRIQWMTRKDVAGEATKYMKRTFSEDTTKWEWPKIESKVEMKKSEVDDWVEKKFWKDKTPQEGKTVDAQQISDKIQNSFVNNPWDKLAKADRLQGKWYSYKEAKTWLTQTWKDIPWRIEIWRNWKWELEILDGRHLLEAYREKWIKIPNDKIKFRDWVTIEDLTKKKSSLPLSQKSEVKYSEPENTELLDFMKKQKVINESSSIWQWKAKKIAEEYPDWFGWISNEWRALPETKEVLKNLEYYTKMLKDFNSSKTSKEFIKKLWKMNIVERMALRKSLK